MKEAARVFATRPPLVLALIVVAACGGTGSHAAAPNKKKVEVDTSTRDDGVERVVAATRSGDAKALRALLGGPLGFGGMWFSDAQCRRQFATAGTIESSRLDAFAACLATIKLVPSERKSGFPDIGVFIYEPGIEVEAMFARNQTGSKLTWIGYVARRNARDALPTIAQRVLESQRIDPQPIALDDTSRARIERELAPRKSSKHAYAWLKVCIDASGAVTGVHPRATTSLVAQDMFVAKVKEWTFHPILLDGQPTPVCSLVHVGLPSPAAKLDDDELEFATTMPYPIPDDRATSVVVPSDLFEREKDSSTFIVPDDDTKTKLQNLGSNRLIGIVMVCVDETGKVLAPYLVRSTGFQSYDNALLSGIAKWRYRPLIADGRPTVACTHVMFDYKQG